MQVDLDYDVTPRPRWGYGQPAHAELHRLINAGRGRYADRLKLYLTLKADLVGIPREAPSVSSDPAWQNPWFTGLDGIALYGLIRA
jgi:hypothetical protein